MQSELRFVEHDKRKRKPAQYSLECLESLTVDQTQSLPSDKNIAVDFDSFFKIIYWVQKDIQLHSTLNCVCCSISGMKDKILDRPRKQ